MLLQFVFLFFANDFTMRFSAARSAFTTAEQPEPLDSFAVGFSFCKTSLSELVGPAARLFQYIQCILRFEISCSFVPFVVLDE